MGSERYLGHASIALQILGVSIVCTSSLTNIQPGIGSMCCAAGYILAKKVLGRSLNWQDAKPIVQSNEDDKDSHSSGNDTAGENEDNQDRTAYQRRTASIGNNSLLDNKLTHAEKSLTTSRSDISDAQTDEATTIVKNVSLQEQACLIVACGLGGPARFLAGAVSLQLPISLVLLLGFLSSCYILFEIIYQYRMLLVHNFARKNQPLLKSTVFGTGVIAQSFTFTAISGAMLGFCSRNPKIGLSLHGAQAMYLILVLFTLTLCAMDLYQKLQGLCNRPIATTGYVLLKEALSWHPERQEKVLNWYRVRTGFPQAYTPDPWDLLQTRALWSKKRVRRDSSILYKESVGSILTIVAEHAMHIVRSYWNAKLPVDDSNDLSSFSNKPGVPVTSYNGNWRRNSEIRSTSNAPSNHDVDFNLALERFHGGRSNPHAPPPKSQGAQATEKTGTNVTSETTRGEFSETSLKQQVHCVLFSSIVWETFISWSIVAALALGEYSIRIFSALPALAVRLLHTQHEYLTEFNGTSGSHGLYGVSESPLTWAPLVVIVALALLLIQPTLLLVRGGIAQILSAGVAATSTKGVTHENLSADKGELDATISKRNTTATNATEEENDNMGQPHPPKNSAESLFLLPEVPKSLSYHQRKYQEEQNKKIRELCLEGEHLGKKQEESESDETDLELESEGDWCYTRISNTMGASVNVKRDSTELAEAKPEKCLRTATKRVSSYKQVSHPAQLILPPPLYSFFAYPETKQTDGATNDPNGEPLGNAAVGKKAALQSWLKESSEAFQIPVPGITTPVPTVAADGDRNQKSQGSSATSGSRTVDKMNSDPLSPSGDSAIAKPASVFEIVGKDSVQASLVHKTLATLGVCVAASGALCCILYGSSATFLSTANLIAYLFSLSIFTGSNIPLPLPYLLFVFRASLGLGCGVFAMACMVLSSTLGMLVHCLPSAVFMTGVFTLVQLWRTTDIMDADN